MKRIYLLLLLLTSGLCFARDLNPGFRIEPYLLDVTGDSATVAFFLHEPMVASVWVHRGPELKKFHSQGEKLAHLIRIKGLEPGMTYAYEVVCKKGNRVVRTLKGDQSYIIKTACRAGEFFSFAVYGDPRPGDTLTHRYHEAVINRVISQEPVFNLVLGDMVDDGADHKLWEDFFRVEGPLLRRSAIYPVLGDNDIAQGKGKFQTYFPHIGSGYYHFEWGGVHFFGLHTWDTLAGQDKEEFNQNSPQYKWFLEEIAKPEVQNAPFRVVFMHDPVYICRGKASDILRNTWSPVFQRSKVDAVFASWHIYERSVDKGVTYIISGGAGAELIQLNKNPAFPSQVDALQYHFCRVDVGNGAMEISSIAIDGTVLDTITLAPRAGYEEEDKQLEKAARRLSKELLIGKTTAKTPAIPLYLFSYDCRYCRKLLKHDLPLLAAQSHIALRVYYFDLGKRGTYDLFLSMGAAFGSQDSDVPVVFMGNRVMGGQREIETHLTGEISKYLADPGQYISAAVDPFKKNDNPVANGDEAFNGLTLIMVLAAGLLDGINPCAFTTIIFLISYLSFLGASRKRILYTGGVFTLAVFLTYFVIGLVFFSFAGIFLKNHSISLVVNVGLLIFVLILALLSFLDYRKCLQGKTAELTLQLPGFLKKGIHKRIREFAGNKFAIISTSFALGVVIAGMELTCTGQVYIPIVTMISEPQYRVMAVLYLFFYNIAFIIPLVVIFLLVFWGFTSEKLAAFFKAHLAGVKLGFVILFLVMATMIIYNLRWFS